MQTLLNTKLPFIKMMRIKLATVRPGLFRMTAYNKDDLILPTSSWVPTLFFNVEHTLYGLNMPSEERDLLIDAADLLDVLSPRYRHPFLDFAALNSETTQLFHELQTILPLWSNPTVWQQATISEEGFHFEQELLQHAMQQKLANAGLSKEDSLALIPYFLNGGWYLQATHTFDGVKIALRLSEPEENEENWLLETVLISPSSAKHWTPATTKRKLPIHAVATEKMGVYCTPN